MRAFVFLYFSIIVSFSAHARYEQAPIASLINSNCILIGTIDSVGSDDFTVKVMTVLKGDLKDSLIQIEKFKDWTCAHRFSEYQKGQRSLFFLLHGTSPGLYHIDGAGNEGEFPIEDDSIYYSSLDSRKNYRVYKGEIWGFRFRKTELIDAIKYFIDHKDEIKVYCTNNNNADSFPNKNIALHFIIVEMLKYPDTFNEYSYDKKDLGDSAVLIQPNSIVAALKMNVFYLGMDNPISISLANENKFIVKTNNGVILSQGSHYFVSPIRIGICTITICDIDGKELDNWQFRVKRIPAPVLTFASQTRTVELNKYFFIACDVLIPQLENFDYEIFFKIKSYKVLISYNDTLTKQFEIKSGNRITRELKDFFKTLKSHDKVIFYDALAELANYPKQGKIEDYQYPLAPLTIYVK